MFNPWRELRTQHLELIVGHVDLPPACGGGVYMPHPQGDVILLDSSLNQVERRCVLTHELIHHERGTHCHRDQPDAWDTVVIREEVRVHDEAVRRLVPLQALRAWCAGRADFLSVEPWEVAEHWHVTEEYAERALFLVNVTN